MNIVIVKREMSEASEYCKALEFLDYSVANTCFNDTFEAYEHLMKYSADLIFIDAEVNSSGRVADGLALAQRIRTVKPQIPIVLCHRDGFYVQEYNQLELEYYLVTPVTKELLLSITRRIFQVYVPQQPVVNVHIQKRLLTIQREDKVVAFGGKMKAIVELLIRHPGLSISNKELYQKVWSGRHESNVEMKVYHNALSRIKKALSENEMNDLIFSTRQSQTWVYKNTAVVSEENN